MGVWRSVGNHRIQVLDDGGVLWEHDAVQPYSVPRHMVGPRDGAVWSVISEDPLTLSPSLHCDPALGGCGAHIIISGGNA